MPGKLIKKLVKKLKNRSSVNKANKEAMDAIPSVNAKKRYDAYLKSDEYKLNVKDFNIKNQRNRVWINKGGKNEKLINVEDVEKHTKYFHKNKKKRFGGAVGPNGVL